MVPDLRPLGIGEILDRAVSLFVRRFAVIVLILAVVAIPIAILQYAATPATGSMFADLQHVLTLPAGHAAEQRAILRSLQAKNQLSALAVFLVLASAMLGALSSTACCIGVAQAYAGRLPSVREVYRAALGRWLAQLVAAVIFLGLGFVLALGFGIVVFFVGLAIGALALVSRIGALIVGIPVGLAALAILFGSIVLWYFSAQMTGVSIALEDANPIRGIGHGIRRTLSPALIRRSALVATIAFSVALIGSLIMLSIAIAVSALAHVPALAPVISVIGGVAINGLLTTFIVIYAIDVRVRREGYDLALAAQNVVRS